MRVRLIAPLTAALVAGTVALTAGTAAAAPTASAPQAAAPAAIAGVSAPLNHTLPNGDVFSGTFTPSRFSNSHGELLVTGVVTGTVTGATEPTGAITPQTVTTTVSRASAPAATSQAAAAAPAQAAASCTVLDLVLGPLHLDLLGLVVDLNQVHLTITAVPGAGNLLGNLLCAVANLLNGSGTLGGLSNLLNQILAILQGL
jgi:hypothetical protein